MTTDPILPLDVNLMTAEMYYDIVEPYGDHVHSDIPRHTLLSDTLSPELRERMRLRLYFSRECVLNELLRDVGGMLGGAYVNKENLSEWSGILHCLGFDLAMAKYDSHIKLMRESGVDSDRWEELVDDHRPSLALIDIPRRDNLIAVPRLLGEVEDDLGVSLLINTMNCDSEPRGSEEPLRLCPKCLTFKPLRDFPSLSLIDSTVMGSCKSCN